VAALEAGFWLEDFEVHGSPFCDCGDGTEGNSAGARRRI
jgi:hypothetical protein